MTKLTRLIQIALILFGLTGLNETVKAQTISTNFFGENAWMPDTIGDVNNCNEPPCLLYGKLHKNWNKVKESGAQVVRFGGIAADRNMPTKYQYIKMIDSIRANGMEPIIQVPFRKYHYTAQQAADIVTYINVTKGKNIKYWIIGNEPDLGYSYSTASQVANYIKPFASAMKAVDPTIKIIGPETAWYDTNIINGLTTPNGPDDITGKDAAGRYYIDIISFHTYPFNGSQTRSQVISKLASAGGLKDNLGALNSRLASCNTAHGRTGANALKTAITEANINWQNSSSDDLYGNGANSFIGGQFIAEMLGIGMKKGVEFINIWSVIEGNSTTLDIGYIDAQTGVKKPSFYHFKMMAENFKGEVANGTSNLSNVKVFGSKNAEKIQVLVMNQDQTTSYNFSVRLNNDPVTANKPLKINVDAGLAKEYAETIPAQSTMLLTFNAQGNIISKTEYSLTTHAAAGLAPTTTQLNGATGIEDGVNSTGSFEMKVFPNPSVGKMTVKLNKGNSTEKNFEIQVFNLVGQEVFNKKTEFNEGKEEVELSPAIANGVYMVRVKEGQKDNFLVEKIMVQR
jgi:hypothetical protein